MLCLLDQHLEDYDGFRLHRGLFIKNVSHLSFFTFDLLLQYLLYCFVYALLYRALHVLEVICALEVPSIFHTGDKTCI